MRFTSWKLVFGCAALLLVIGCDRTNKTTPTAATTPNPTADLSTRLYGVWESTERPTITVNGKTVADYYPQSGRGVFSLNIAGAYDGNGMEIDSLGVQG